MGFWKTGRGIGGDSWADEMRRCMKNLQKIVAKNSKTYGGKDHEINMAEFADLVEFCSRGHIVASLTLEDGKRPLSQLHSDKSVKTYPNRGQIHCKELGGNKCIQKL